MLLKSALLVSTALIAVLLFRQNPQITSPKPYAGMSELEARVFSKACKDCHSNDTEWPWYAKIPPISLGVAADVHKGRAAWNLSEWPKYSRGKRLGFLSAIAVGAVGERMPPLAYRLVHPESRLNAKDRTLLVKWATEERSRLIASRDPVAAK